MSLVQIVNGETGLSTRTKLNTLFPRVNETFVPATGVQLDRVTGSFYVSYNQSGALSLKIAAGSVQGGGAEVPVVVDGVAITILDENDADITVSAKDPKSDTADTTPGNTDRYVFWNTALGIKYSITNLGLL